MQTYHLNVNQTPANSHQALPFHCACLSGNTDAVDFLIESCQADVNVADALGQTALHLLLLNGNYSMVKHLVGLPQTNVNAADKSGSTVLHKACSAGFVDVVSLLFFFVWFLFIVFWTSML